MSKGRGPPHPPLGLVLRCCNAANWPDLAPLLRSAIGLTPHEDLMTALVPEEDDGAGIGNVSAGACLGH